MPDLSGNEESYVVAAMRSSWISSTGEFIDRFESEFAEVCGAKYALSVCNGTVALHLAMLALDVRPGDEVIVPGLTYIAAANAVRYVGAEPVFVDVDPETWCLNPSLIEESITTRTRGIVAVHLYGHPADMDRINHIAAIHGLWVVEDAAEAHFARYKDRPVGGLARIGTFSFYGNKIITCGEGGAVVVSDPQLYTRMKTLRGQGVDPDRRYYHPVTGYNFRLTNVACAILCAQLERAASLIAARRRVFESYSQRLEGKVQLQPRASWAQPAPWLFSMLAGNRDAVADRLRGAGVETRPFFVSMETLPPFRESSLKRRAHLMETGRLSRSGLNLPTYPQLTEEEIGMICDTIVSG
jgi:perosamine synthetase